MRNLFDQYDQNENKLTHALACSLDQDRDLLKQFLKWVGIKEKISWRNLHITEQQRPGIHMPEESKKGKTLPDACVFNDDGWLLLIESKIESGISTNQLRGHIELAERQGFELPKLLLISIRQPKASDLESCSYHKTWKEVYEWLTSAKALKSTWARHLAQYMETLENTMASDGQISEGTLTMFNGVHFDQENPYNYQEAKRLVRLIADELQRRKELHKIGLDPKGERRKAISGTNLDFVWDILPLKFAQNQSDFRLQPHMDVAIAQSISKCTITFPNAIKGLTGPRGQLAIDGIDAFKDALIEVERKSGPITNNCQGSRAMFYLQQRHFLSQRSAGIKDGEMAFDLRTLVDLKNKKLKFQPQWIDAAYSLLTSKKSNIQFGVHIEFPHDCQATRTKKAIDYYAKSLIAMSPILDIWPGHD